MVDADTSLAASQPMTNTAESLVSFASDGIAKQSQDAEVSGTQPVIDNGATSLSKVSTEEHVCVAFFAVGNFAFVIQISNLSRILGTLCLKIQMLWKQRILD